MERKEVSLGTKRGMEQGSRVEITLPHHFECQNQSQKRGSPGTDVASDTVYCKNSCKGRGHVCSLDPEVLKMEVLVPAEEFRELRKRKHRVM